MTDSDPLSKERIARARLGAERMRAVFDSDAVCEAQDTVLAAFDRLEKLEGERDRLLAVAEAVAKYEAALKRETFAPDDAAAQVAAAEVRIAHVKMLNALDAWKAAR